MTAEWHYGEEEPSNGPVSLEELKQLVASGQVQPTHMVWKAGMPEWRAAGDVEELFPKQATVSEAAPLEQPPLTDKPVRVALASRGTLILAATGIAVLGIVAVVLLLVNRSSPKKELSKADSGATAQPAVTESKSEPKPVTPPEPVHPPTAVELAQAALKTNPSDPEANLTVGKQVCFVEDKWTEGLPMLAQGSDAILKQLATEEMRKPTAPEEQAKLGKGWLEFAGTAAGPAWKVSQQRAVRWCREAYPKLTGAAKAEVEKMLKGLDEQPPEFEVLARQAVARPDESNASARCTGLTMDVSKTDVGPGAGYAGLELKGVRFLDVAVKASSRFRHVGNHSFAGFMIDYGCGSGYAKRVALSIGVFDKERPSKTPDWGKIAVPDEYVDLGEHEHYDLDLQTWAPPNWDGRIWYTTVLQAAGPNKSITAELVPLVKQRAATQETAIPEGKGVEVPSSSRAAMRGWTKTSGEKIEAEFVKKDKSIITLRKPDGTEFTVRMAHLSDEDQQYVREHASSQAKPEK